MRSHTKGSMRLLVLLAALGLLAAGCGGDATEPATDTDLGTEPATDMGTETGTEAAGEGATGTALSDASVTVGSKEFTEQLILGQITIQALEAAGASVEDQTGLVGSTTVREALLSGEIDMYWEYTGTGWITHLGNTEPVTGEQEQFDAVAEADVEDNDIVWLDPAPFNNTYAIAASSETADEFGVTTLSDLAAFAGDNPDQATLCAAAEFLTRDDGLPGLQEAYGFEFSDVAELELGLVYPSIDKADPCNFGEVFATDGRIAALDLTVLEDDEQFFASYLPSLNVRSEVLDEHPQIADVIAPIAEALDTETMQSLNAAVDVDGEDPAAVASQFLEENGLLP